MMLGGIKIFKGNNFKDKRGYIWTSWLKKKYRINFIQDKFSLSKKNVFRGLHYDEKTWKLISCVYGKIFFVIVNCDKNSKYYLKHKTWYLSHTKNMQILIPPNYTNGHLCLSKECLFHYKLFYKGKYSDVKQQKVLKWNSDSLNIKWPSKKKFISSIRDK